MKKGIRNTMIEIGIADSLIIDSDAKISIEQAMELASIYAKKVRDKQIEMCAMWAVSHIAYNVRGLDGLCAEDNQYVKNDYDYLKACVKVEIDK